MITSITDISMSAGREFRSLGAPLLSGSDIVVPVSAPHKRTAKPHRREQPVTPRPQRIPDPVPTRRETPEPVRTAPQPVPAEPVPVP